jgi:hypothetical protein
MASLDVYVVDEENEPVASELVKVRLTQSLHFGEGFAEAYTDSDGHAEIDVDDDNLPDSIEIFVRGESQGEQPFEDGAGFTVNI